MTNGRRGFATSTAKARPIDPLAQRKREQREEARRKRQRAHALLAGSAGAQLQDSFLAHATMAPGSTVAGYAPIRDEIDVMPLLSALAARGHGCALPVVTGRERPLVFRAWAPGAALTEAAFGVGVPPSSSPEVTPDVVLVPMLAFDAACRRIGYGAGYYDRTLAGLRAGGTVLAIGIAYADQQVDEVPADEHDQILDMIVTERSVIRARG